MNIKPIASSSSGCAYVVESGEYQLLIECGVPLKKIREALNHDLSKVIGCVVSHEHGDHANYLPKLENETNIPIWCSRGVKKRFDLSMSHNIVNKFTFYPVADLAILCLKLDHDVECFGFMIYLEKKKLFYATDTNMVDYTFPGLSHLMIEANHSFESMIESDRNNSVVKRTLETHLDIDQVVEFVKRHPALEEIHLIHLSDDHSDADLFQKMVSAAIGVPVFVAEK